MSDDAVPKAQFASDNTAGVCPEAWQAMERANRGHVSSYGTDAWTQRAADLLRELFEKDDAEVFFVFNGTSANSLALASCCQSYHSVICHEHAHIVDDECGAPEFFSNGTKLLGATGEYGKISPAEIEHLALKRTDIHYPKPRVVSLTQSTEYGTVYQLAELQAIHAVTQRHHLAAEFDYRCKQAGQLASKMRFLASSWVGMLENGAWLRHAQYANACAQRLAARFEQIGLPAAHSVDANAAFIPMPDSLYRALKQRGWLIYNFIGGATRLMCSWNTTDADIDALLADVTDILKKS
jgi:threonine aldolase